MNYCVEFLALIKFDETISLGQLLATFVTLASFGLALYTIFRRQAKDNAKLEMKIQLMWQQFKRDHKIKNGDE